MVHLSREGQQEPRRDAQKAVEPSKRQAHEANEAKTLPFQVVELLLAYGQQGVLVNTSLHSSSRCELTIQGTSFGAMCPAPGLRCCAPFPARTWQNAEMQRKWT